jgi:hypothetical protein
VNRGDESLVTTLTEQELQAAYLARYDLGPGYPQLPVASYVHDLYLDDATEDLSLKFAPFWTPEKQQLVDAELEKSLARFLGLNASAYSGLFCTFSGSVALDRAFTAAISGVAPQRSKRATVITTSPSIDIMRLFLQERRLLSTRFVESRRAEPWGLSKDGILEDLKDLAYGPRSAAAIVLLTSPENPTGCVWSRDDLRSIAEDCFRCGGILVVDHTFLTAGVHKREEVDAVWDVLGPDTDWIAIWDTGKTFGLNEDKLGFIVCGSQRTEQLVREALGVLQFGVSRRQKLFFTELLTRSFYFGHSDDLHAICCTNLKMAATMCESAGLTVIGPTAGSLCLIELQNGVYDETVRRSLLRLGVGVVAGNVFFHTRWRPHSFIRVALARDPDYFSEGMGQLCSHVGSFQ